MATSDDLRRLALALEGTTDYPHFDRRAFKAARTFATLAADGRTANIHLTPDAQALKCTLAPDTFAALDNAWGRQGWTCVTLAQVSEPELADILRLAWGVSRSPPRKAKKRQRHQS